MSQSVPDFTTAIITISFLLVLAGIALFAYQVNGYFTDNTHHYQHEKQIEAETKEHSHGDGHSHSH